MKRLVFLFLFYSFVLKAQNKLPFKQGEFLSYQVSYGLVTAGVANLELKNPSLKGKNYLHIIGTGVSTGITDFFFKVEDRYESYFDAETLRPHRFIRKIKEGGHSKDKEIFFDFNRKEAKVINHKKNRTEFFPIEKDVLDMLLSVYYFRAMDFSKLEDNEVINMKMFYDETTHPFQLKVLGREMVNTKFGRINCLKVVPMVEKGRVFKENESLTIWFSDDQNKIPIKLKASILVGSIKMELDNYTGLAYPHSTIFN
ncbi:DUF3108 domain-containing protein [Namhaeicola litoreus]|uniref:DUF3108 domain-containing protein n=1 Tax=Namhaeicola litoreus TaxID=1052145 RepID=A0ABW3XZL4_9FLAO